MVDWQTLLQRRSLPIVPYDVFGGGKPHAFDSRSFEERPEGTTTLSAISTPTMPAGTTLSGCARAIRILWFG